MAPATMQETQIGDFAIQLSVPFWHSLLHYVPLYAGLGLTIVLAMWAVRQWLQQLLANSLQTFQNSLAIEFDRIQPQLDGVVERALTNVEKNSMATVESNMDGLRKELMQAMTDMETRLGQKTPPDFRTPLDETRALLHKQTKSSMQEITDLSQTSLQSWIGSEIQSRLDSMISLLTGVQVELTAQTDLQLDEKLTTVSATVTTIDTVAKEIQSTVGECLGALRDARINDAAQHQSTLTAVKQTQAMLNSLRGEVVPPLQHVAGAQTLRNVEQNLDLANQTVWTNQGHLKHQSEALDELSTAMEKALKGLTTLQTQLERVISRLTPPQQKAPPPSPPSSTPDDTPGGKAPAPCNAATPSSSPPPPTVSPGNVGSDQVPVPVLRIQESLPIRQPVSLFSSLPQGMPAPPFQWGNAQAALQGDPRAREALSYLAQSFGMMG
ncbi:unnamed protein product [Symbiodinium sp. CCMP2592]|nr:unnamed protein product [Symbiodinium sp. CCMP2592]